MDEFIKNHGQIIDLSLVSYVHVFIITFESLNSWFVIVNMQITYSPLFEVIDTFIEVDLEE